ncbi:peptidyl-tRNA hydrolase [Candidatus Roizmanbacteria bacterium]|nr:peptidyl-tRNA hydrolase [Candidatus Roizmanbacteria bacterium]
MRLIVGLGNQGIKYRHNRHNVGQMFIDYLGKQLKKAKISEIKLVKTGGFMNESGRTIKKLTADYPLPSANLLIAHDDLDIPFGKFKIAMARGPRLHNGISSIEKELDTKDFWRIRIGVENRTPLNRPDGETYVLTDFTPFEKQRLPEIFDRVIKRLFFLSPSRPL